MTKTVECKYNININIDTDTLEAMTVETLETLVNMTEDEEYIHNGLHFYCKWNTLNDIDEYEDERDINAIFDATYGPIAFTVQVNANRTIDVYDYEFVINTITFTLDELIKREW